MAELPKNVFQMLDDEGLTVGDSKDSSGPTTAALESSDKPAGLSAIDTSGESEVLQNESGRDGATSGDASISDPSIKSGDAADTNWTVKQSTRTRRLAPQFILSRADLGTESPRNRSQALEKDKEKEKLEKEKQERDTRDKEAREKTEREREPIKKKAVTRFSRDELLKLRRPTKILDSMKDFGDVISVRPLDPVTLNPLEPDEIMRRWNNNVNAPPKGDNFGRGRGNLRGPIRKDDNDNERSRGGDSDSIWDDGKSSSEGGTFDLADIAAAALKFQADTIDLSALKLPIDRSEEANFDEEDEDEVPEWARDDDAPSAPAQFSTAKRSLLLETLNVKNVSSAKVDLGNVQVVDEVIDFSSSLSSSIFLSGDNSNNGGVVDLPSIPHSIFPQFFNSLQIGQALGGPHVVQPPVIVDEWMYLDPNHNVQGPFSSENMRCWHEAGYFQMDLPIQLSNWGSFHPLVAVFPNFIDAFRTLPPEPSLELNSRLLEQQRRQKEVAEQQRLEQERAYLEQQRFEQQRLEQQRLEQQRQEQLRMEKLLLEQRRQQELLEQQRRQQEMAMIDQQRQQQQQQYLAEQQRRQQLEQQQQQQQQQLLEEQRRREAHLLEQHRREQLLRQQQELEEQRRQEQLRMEQLLAEEQRRRQQLSANVEQQRSSVGSLNRDTGKVTHPESIAPWAKSNSSSTGAHSQKVSLLDIQKIEETESEKAKRQEEAIQRANSLIKSGSGAIWGSSQPVASGPTLLDIQNEEERRRREEEAANRAAQKSLAGNGNGPTGSSQLKSLLGVHSPVSKSVGTWPAKAGPPPAPSLREIMQQEVQQQPRDAPKAASNSWAAKASTATPSSTWSAPVSALATPVSVVKAPESGKVAISQPKPDVSSQPLSVQSRSNITAAPSQSQPRGDPSGFGGSAMSRETAEWCAGQLKKINGSEDITLMEFCATLKSAIDIREYLAAYLGSTPQVSQFATEFIRRKEERGLSVGTPLNSAPVASVIAKKKKK